MESMENTDQLVNYIIQQRRQGVTEPQIRAILLQTGWPQPTIDQAFAFIEDLKRSAPADYQAPQANLPAITAANPEPMLLTRSTPDSGKQKTGRRLLITVIIIALLGGAIAAAIVFASNNASKDNQSTPPKPTQKVNLDVPRREILSKLGDKLVGYYKSNNTYPTMSALNDTAFSGSKDGFDATNYRDPDWTKTNKACTDKSGRPILVNDRTDGCFTYRATAMNGNDCDGKTTLCTRVVITANLHNKKPVLVILDEDNKQIQ